MRACDCETKDWAHSRTHTPKLEQKPVELDEKVNADMMLMRGNHMAPPGFDGSCQH